jgi:hypothetical protein
VWQVPAGVILGSLAEILICTAANLMMLGCEPHAGMTILSGIVTPLPLWVKDGDHVYICGGNAGDVELRFSRGGRS